MHHNFFKTRRFAWYIFVCRNFHVDDTKMVHWNVRNPVLAFMLGELYLMLIALRFTLIRQRLRAVWLALQGYPLAIDFE